MAWFGGESVVRITGPFGRDAAEQLRRELSGEWGSEPATVVIDFSLARDVSDVALAALLLPLSDGALRLRFRGLTHRQRQLLRLLTPADPGRQPRASDARRRGVSHTDAQ